ncbi:uncharacterized protein LOC132048699 [Lycium ferocissimum]|uniref:uncharacterized protein LOC132048699 n=1 Tax=Lycium ferocissimum TaxID=112874 RepID=UPI002814AA01|nr:uncharacterized protein LOC132048699 [Lycium ferocissimum]
MVNTTDKPPDKGRKVQSDPPMALNSEAKDHFQHNKVNDQDKEKDIQAPSQVIEIDQHITQIDGSENSMSKNNENTSTWEEVQESSNIHNNLQDHNMPHSASPSNNSDKQEGICESLPPETSALPDINLVVELVPHKQQQEITEKNHKDSQQEQEVTSPKSMEIHHQKQILNTNSTQQNPQKHIPTTATKRLDPEEKKKNKSHKGQKQNIEISSPMERLSQIGHQYGNPKDSNDAKEDDEGFFTVKKGVKSKKAIHRLKKIIHIHKIKIVAILEPFVSINKIDAYMRYLGFQYSLNNLNGKIWFFWNSNYRTSIISNTDQQITIKMSHSVSGKHLFITTIYAKCTAAERKDLWISLENVYLQVDGPWCLGGDFNVILNPSEKLGGKPHRMYKSLDFSSCMDNCELTDIGFMGPNFTWCNNRRPVKRIWKRLDRVFINDSWGQLFHNNIVRHLPRTGSDHRPLLINCHNAYKNGIKYFKFLDFWTEQPNFYQLVEETWNVRIFGNPMWILQQKLKILSKKLSQWSRDVIGNVYDEVNMWETKMHDLENLDSSINTEQTREDLNKGNAEYIRWLDMQDKLLKQKAHIKWTEEGDRNSKYFHCLIRDRRRRLQLHRIKNSNGNWVQGDEDISKAAIHHFEHMFNLNHNFTDHDILNVIPNCINNDENEALIAIPDMEEIRNAVFNMSPSSAAGPDGYNGNFFHKCWTVIQEDIKNMVESHLLDKLISKPPFCQSCVLITENVLLAQELAQGVSQTNQGGNMIIKLDMAKAYDRMSWDFLLAVMSKFGFSDSWTTIIRRLISDVWYSTIINGERKGFFTSSQGLKQGDPLSPSLFIIAAEVLSRLLNSLQHNDRFVPFGITEWSNH